MNINLPQNSNAMTNRVGKLPSFRGNVTKQVPQAFEEAVDTFVKSNSQNVLNRIRFNSAIRRLLPDIMKSENFLNCGRASKVYEGSEKYVLRIKRGKNADNAVHIYSVPSKVTSKFDELDSYYGSPVARIGNVEILRNATPSENSVNCGAIWANEYVAGGMDKYSEHYIPTCSSLPQESFDKFAMDLKKLNGIKSIGGEGVSVKRPWQIFKRRYYKPDTINPNNVLISDGQFRIVDQMGKTANKNPNSVWTMLEPLVLRLTPDVDAKFDPKMVEDRRKIVTKTIIAATKADLPMTNTLYEYNDWTLMDICNDKKYTDVISDLCASQKDGKNVQSRLEYLRGVFPDEKI